MQKPTNSYCYVSTLDHGVAESSRRLGLAPRGEVGGRRIFFSAPEVRDGDYLAVMNDIGDYDVDRIKSWLRSGGGGVPDFDSLVSAAFQFERGFACTGDFWGINSHYWFRDGTTFCCSDNVFLVATIAGRDFSRESLWEYLFFLSPAGERTWFHDVRKLRPGETILYDAAKHDLAITDPFDIESALRERAPHELNDALSGFFEGTKRVLEGRSAAVSISAGSDSNTVLSCVRGFGIPYRAYSFGTPHLVETRQIELNSKRLAFDWTLVDMSDFGSSWRDRFRRTLPLTNGLLNPYRTHYQEYYGAIPREAAVFEGLMGSQFMKGEFAAGSTISRAYRTAITTDEPLDHIIRREYAGFSEPFLGGMIEYITDAHGARLKNVNTPDGFEAYRSWAFEFIPGRIFSGIVLLASRDHSVYQPLISPMILGSLYRRGLGFVGDLNFREAYGGAVSSLEPEALIVREMDRDIFENVLDRGISFREVLELPPWRLKLARKRRNILRKLRNRNFRFGQVDNRAIRDEVGGYAQSLAGSHQFIDELLRGERWNKEAATLGMMLESIRRS
jgi:hypothetical protein